MTHDLSPAVERARDAARESAQQAGAAAVRLTDWLLGLLADDEGKPATLLQRVGADPAAVRDALSTRANWVHPPASADGAVFAAARDKAIALRGDPGLTTEFVLLAVLDADPAFREQLTTVGVDTAALEAVLAPNSGADPTADDGPGPTFTVSEPVDLADAGRVVDANLNRAREALRVVEDYCRFVLDDRTLTETVKDLRHDLAAAASTLPNGVLLAARDTPGDVGTSVTAGGEYVRRSAAEVAVVNLKRLQEALRSVEEYGKVFGPQFGRAAERVRYGAYALEPVVLRGGDLRSRLAAARLYVLLTGAQCAASLDWTIAEAAAGGATVFQLREKDLSDRELLTRARNVRRWTRAAGALFIVNDRPDVARFADADGVHLGQDDLPVAAARRLLGPDALIGVSTHTPDQLRAAVRGGADYVGVGPTFPSTTKAFDTLAGLDFVRFAASKTSLPAFVLGGVGPANVAEVAAAGGTRVAVSAAVCQADEPRLAAAQLLHGLSS